MQYREKVPPLWGRAPRGAGMLCRLDAAVGWRWHRSSPQWGQTSQFLEAAKKVLGLKHMANNAVGYLGFPGLRLAMDDRTWQLFFSSTWWPCLPPEELSSSGHDFTHTPLLWSCQTPKTILPQVPRTFPSWLKIEGQWCRFSRLQHPTAQSGIKSYLNGTRQLCFSVCLINYVSAMSLSKGELPVETVLPASTRGNQFSEQEKLSALWLVMTCMLQSCRPQTLLHGCRMQRKMSLRMETKRITQVSSVLCFPQFCII